MGVSVGSDGFRFRWVSVGIRCRCFILCSKCIDVGSVRCFLSGMNIVTYLRVSTELQDHAPQRLELSEYCTRQGWSVAGEYTDTLSGARAERPGLEAMLERCRAGGIEAVCCVKLDRLGRSVINVVTLIADLEVMGVAVICTSQGIDTRAANPCGKMQYQIIAAVAEFEREMIRERTKAGLAVARAAGKKLGRPSPTLIAEPARSGVIAQWRAEGGVGLRRLAERLGGVSVATARMLAMEGGK